VACAAGAPSLGERGDHGVCLRVDGHGRNVQDALQFEAAPWVYGTVVGDRRNAYLSSHWLSPESSGLEEVREQVGSRGHVDVRHCAQQSGLSEFLCVGHTMTARSQYAETEEAGAAGKPP
jgi:hypothetical protein